MSESVRVKRMKTMLMIVLTKMTKAENDNGGQLGHGF